MAGDYTELKQNLKAGCTIPTYCGKYEWKCSRCRAIEVIEELEKELQELYAKPEGTGE